MKAEIHGDLARILAFCEEGERKQKLPGTGVPVSLLSAVAGARNWLYLLLVATVLPRYPTASRSL